MFKGGDGDPFDEVSQFFGYAKTLGIDVVYERRLGQVLGSLRRYLFGGLCNDVAQFGSSQRQIIRSFRCFFRKASGSVPQLHLSLIFRLIAPFFLPISEEEFSQIHHLKSWLGMKENNKCWLPRTLFRHSPCLFHFFLFSDPSKKISWTKLWPSKHNNAIITSQNLKLYFRTLNPHFGYDILGLIRISLFEL